jgi:hypothetical protein
MADTKKEKAKQAQDKYRASEKYRVTAWKAHLKRTYNLSVEDYESLLVIQNYSCKICGSTKANREWKTKAQRIDLFVDHCHTTGKIRGLLCNKCNVGIAMFNEDFSTLTSAISYLKENSFE